MKKKWIIALSFSALMSVSFSNSVDAATYVKGYFKKNGTYVSPHFRSDADSSFYNNYSTYGNINPFTGERGTKLSPNMSNSHYIYLSYIYSNLFDENEYENVSAPIRVEQYAEPKEELTKEEYKANNKDFYGFKESTEDIHTAFVSSTNNTVKNHSVDDDLSRIIEEFKAEVEKHEVGGQYESARIGLVEELGLMQDHIQSGTVDYEELSLQIESIELNYQDVLIVYNRIEDME
ncbi:hypothetical protein [Peribacillus simplex]|uniref:Uncharacterized protein n=1 Tax=Peribacillus simplex TaxID=1478 RepID=A0AAN2PF80_9BACI|nr:hypothetical protein [Peribacillus simplex]CEG31464.1 hypothetical protein BN1180_01608 [Peribacillus simplex]